MGTIALIAALTLFPGQNGELALTNVRTTYGLQGAVRADGKLLPGDELFLSFDIEGVTVDADGKVHYGIALEVADSDGKIHFKQAPKGMKAHNSLGGTSLPGFANLKIGLDQKPGAYTVKVKVTDLAAKASKEITKAIEILPKGFGLVRVATTIDPDGQIAAPFLGEGQSLWINFAAVVFQRGENGQPDLGVSLRVLDEGGKPTLARALSGAVTKDIPKNLKAVPMQFMLNLNRAGKFTIEIKASDKVSGNTTTLSFPLTVLKR